MTNRKFARLMGAALALCAATAAQAGPIANAPSVEAFSQLAPIAQPILSPDGTKMAAKVARDGEYVLMILPIGGGSSPSVIGTGDLELLDWTWVNNDWLVVQVGTTEDLGQLKDLYMTRALGVSADGSKIVPLLKGSQFAGQNGGSVIWTAEDGSPRALLSVQRSIYTSEGFWPEVQMVDVSTGDHKPVVASQKGIFNWFADYDGVVHMGIGRTIGNVGKPRMMWRDSENGAFRDLAVSDEENTPIPVQIADGKVLAYADDENGFQAIYEYDPTTQKLGKQLFASKGYDIGSIIPTSDGKGIAGVRYEEAASKITWVDPRMKAIQGEIDAKLVNANASIQSLSKDYNRAIVKIGSAETPGAYFLYDRKANTVSPIAKVNAAIGSVRLNPVKAVRYAARDGLEIEAIMTLPRGKEAKGLPIIVMPHGGPFARDDVSWDFWTQHLASQGYAVIQPNYRGSSGYGTQFADKGKGEWGLKMQDDVDDAVTYLAKQGIGDAKRACIVGGSYGGYAAMRAAQRGGIYRCAVSFAGVSDLARLSREDGGSLFAGKRKQWLKDQAPDFRSVSPLNYPEQFSMPLLLVHGVKDKRVSVGHSREMAKRLQAAGKDVTYVEQPLADHHFSRSEDRLEFLKAEDAFLQKHNPS